MTALGVALLGSWPTSSEAKPPDLPIDPRVECREGLEMANQPARPDLAPLPPPKEGVNSGEIAAGSDGQSTSRNCVKPTDQQIPVEALLIHLDHDCIFNIVLRVIKTDSCKQGFDLAIPLLCSPGANLAVWVIDWISDTFPGCIEQDDDAEECDRHWPELRDPEFLEMLRSTVPLNLPPILPEMDDETSVRGEKLIRRASYDPVRRNCPRSNLRPAAVSSMLTGAKQVDDRATLRNLRTKTNFVS